MIVELCLWIGCALNEHILTHKSATVFNIPFVTTRVAIGFRSKEVL